MATWAVDGQIAGFGGTAASSGSLDPGEYLLASPGSVDLNGPTRLHRSVPGGYINALRAQGIRINLTAGDISFNGVSVLSPKRIYVSMFVVEASRFAEGATPTPRQILAQGAQVRVYRSAESRVTTGELVVTAISGPTATALKPNTKYWVLVLPTCATAGSQPSVWNDYPAVADNQIDTVGRAVSLWTNRQPAKPVVTSPIAGSVVNAGDSVTLTFDPQDPDEVAGGTSSYYLDLAGVQVQYAPRPTAEEPNPVWVDLPWANSTGSGTGNGWYIDGSTYSGPTDGTLQLWLNKTAQIKCGSTTLTANRGVLPSGDWQIRVRTFDYGHPHPLAVPPVGRVNGDLAPANYPAENVSPWSDPINISVSAQVPPPLLLSPINNTAIPEGKPVVLAWQYRNTVTPPFPQARRKVEVRRVGGDPAWTVVVDQASALTSIDVTSLTEEIEVPGTGGAPPFSWTDTCDATAGWTMITGYPSGASVAVVSGNIRASLAEAPDWNDGGGFQLRRDLASASVPTAGVKTITISGSRRNYEPDFGSTPLIQFRNAGSLVPSTLIASSGLNNTGPGNIANAAWSATYTIADGVAVDQIDFYFAAGVTPVAGPNADPDFNRLDINQIDITVPGSGSGPSTIEIPFFRATNAYEWRVQVRDSDNVDSNYSSVGRFWIVPAPNTGAVLPVSGAVAEEAGTLGVGTHRVVVYRRGGTKKVGDLTSISKIEWGRIRDDISTAKVTISEWSDEEAELLKRLQSWAYEIAIYRHNGFTEDRVWEGPITLPSYHKDKVVINAKDVMVHPYRRIVKQAFNDNGDGDLVTSRAARITQAVMAPDDPNVLAYLQVVTRSNDARQYRALPPFSRTAFEEIDDMAANAGLDYTTVGRSIIYWGTRNSLGQLPEFRDEHLGESPIVSEYGMRFANFYSVGDGTGVHGDADRLGVSGNDETYGLVEILSSSWASDSQDDTGTFTQEGLAKVVESFEGFAERSIDSRYPPPVVVRLPDNTSLHPETPVSIQHLVPGVLIPIRSKATLREVYGTQKLDSVSVVEEKGKETITVTMSPWTPGSTVDTDTGTEGGVEE